MKKIINFFRSMKFWVFFVLAAVSILTGIVSGLLIWKNSYDNNLEIREKEVCDYAEELCDSIRVNAFLANSELNADMNRKMVNSASFLDGRIIVFNSMLRVVADTYNTSVGKTLISSDAIETLKGENIKKDEKENRCVCLTFPIRDMEDKEKTVGGIIIVYSVADIAESSENLRISIQFIFVILVPVIILLSILHSMHLAAPLKRITASVEHISEGYVEDKVDITGFTEVEQISDSFNEMLSRIAKLEASRQEFVSNVSHELKTPMTSMKIMADTLVSQPDAPIEMYQELMNDITNEITREDRIISDLLALVKMDRTNGDMHIASVSINELIEIIMKRIRPIALSKNVDLTFESRRDVLAEVDGVKLSLALTNLIENGVKYNRDGGQVNVVLDCDHRSFTVVVSDTGIGIPAESQDRIFDRFYRVDKARSRETGGTGLGLSITKNVVLMHKGSVKVESSEGEGTTFTMKIPLNYISDQN